jgi:hypothetical protein
MQIQLSGNALTRRVGISIGIDYLKLLPPIVCAVRSKPHRESKRRMSVKRVKEKVRDNLKEEMKDKEREAKK